MVMEDLTNRRICKSVCLRRSNPCEVPCNDADLKRGPQVVEPTLSLRSELNFGPIEEEYNLYLADLSPLLPNPLCSASDCELNFGRLDQDASCSKSEIFFCLFRLSYNLDIRHESLGSYQPATNHALAQEAFILEPGDPDYFFRVASMPMINKPRSYSDQRWRFQRFPTLNFLSVLWGLPPVLFKPVGLAVDTATKTNLPTSRISDDTEKNVSKIYRQLRTRLSGWRGGIFAGIVMTSCVLVTNVVLLILSLVRYEADGNENIRTVREADCQSIRTVSLWLHVLINVLSTALLASSNYCMQRLSAPTRGEVDEAHSRGKWVDIGVPSIRNLAFIERKKGILWLALALSSIPLHLMYNSVFFEAVGTSYYIAAAVDERILQNKSWNLSAMTPSASYFLSIQPNAKNSFQSLVEDFLASNGSGFRNLSTSECVSTYADPFVFGGGDVLAVSRDQSISNDSVFAVGITLVPNSNGWDDDRTYAYSDEHTLTRGQVSLGKAMICTDDDTNTNKSSTIAKCDAKNKGNSGNWTIKGYHIDYCLSQDVKQHCKLQTSPGILGSVVFCNIIKLVCLAITFWILKDMPLITAGDAAASFLEHPDPITKGHCLLSCENVEDFPVRSEKTWFSERKRWHRSAGRERRFACMFSCFAMLTIATCLLVTMDLQSDDSSSSSSSLGLGRFSAATIVPVDFDTEAIVPAVLLSNLPQFVISCIYVLYNGILTSMLSSAEWATFSSKRQPLRVSRPTGSQYATYRLQLPYKYAIPLIFTSMSLHWLTSQTIYLARISYYGTYLDNNGTSQDREVGKFFGCGFSSGAIIGSLAIGYAMFVFLIGMTYRRFPANIPLISSNSLAISAACHRPEDDVDAATLPLMWGVVERDHATQPVEDMEMSEQSVSNDRIETSSMPSQPHRHEGDDAVTEHCCLTSHPVKPVVEGRRYA